jgi:TetR/AcrR family transcriptional regulator, transcriptional repressor of aconitase
MSPFRSHLARLQSFLLSTQPKYATQGASHRRTEDAILQATKVLVSQSGLTKISMIDISSASEVARATLYNHFRDKQSVIEALLASEVAHELSERRSLQVLLQML